MYKTMMYFVSLYTATTYFFKLPNLHYIKGKLRKTAFDYTKFDSISRIPWIAKPLFGWISDSIYPFGFR
jgi:hypothetical protein